MRVRRFFAPDMRQAIRLVREAQGPDAVILSNRKIEGGVEIIAAVDYDESLIASPSPASSADQAADKAPEAHRASEDNRQADASAAATPAPGAAIHWDHDPAIDAMREEIRQLRGLLENQLAHLAWADLNRREPLRTDLLRRLTRLGLDPALVEQLVARTAAARDEEHAWQLALAELAAMLPVDEQNLMDSGGVVALVGSTGVGKTTSIAKLAARYVLRHGQRQVALVTTDCYRIGAHEQLMTYGRILGVPVQVASSREELRSALRSLSDKRLVLIDTAGMSQRDVRLSEQFATLADSGVPIRTLLVLSATLQRSVLQETVRAFSGVALDGALITKIDEAASLGGLLSVVTHKHLPLAFIADGQRVPEDLHPARAQNLVQRAAELASKGEWPHESALAEQYGGVEADVLV